MRLYHVPMLHQNKLKLLDYMLEFTLIVVFVKLKYTHIMQKLVIIATSA